MNPMQWMVAQPKINPMTTTTSEGKGPDRYVKRSDGSMVLYAEYAEDLAASVLNMLQEHGSACTISYIRGFISQGLFVGAKPTQQSAELSAVLKKLLKDGQISKSSEMPYLWSSL